MNLWRLPWQVPVRIHVALHAQGTRLHQLCIAALAMHSWLHTVIKLAASSELLYATAKSAD